MKTTTDQVIDAATKREALYYHAPLDLHPSSLLILKIFKNRKIRVAPWHDPKCAFTVDDKHLDRFRGTEAR